MKRTLKKGESVMISFRLNTEHPTDQKVIELLGKLEERGYNKREAFSNALLQQGNVDPELYRPSRAGLDASVIADVVETTVHSLLEEFASYILQNIQTGAIVVPNSDDDSNDNEMSALERRIAQSFMQRKEQK